MIPFLNLFRELAPFLARRQRIDELPIWRGEPFINPTEDGRSRIREISLRDLAKFTDLPLIVCGWLEAGGLVEML